MKILADNNVSDGVDDKKLSAQAFVDRRIFDVVGSMYLGTRHACVVVAKKFDRDSVDN